MTSKVLHGFRVLERNNPTQDFGAKAARSSRAVDGGSTDGVVLPCERFVAKSYRNVTDIWDRCHFTMYLVRSPGDFEVITV